MRFDEGTYINTFDGTLLTEEIYANDEFVADSYESGTGTSEAFHQLLNDYVYGNSSQKGIKIRKAASGINDYLSDLGLNVRLVSEYTTNNSAINMAISMLQEGHPVVASMSTIYDAPYDHSVLIYRAQFDSVDPVGTAVFTMNMGWKDGTSDGQSNTEYVASAGWFYECGYIESTCSTHSLTSWTEMDVAYHWRNCVNCHYVEVGKHSDFWDSILSRCKRCGRTGFSGNIKG